MIFTCVILVFKLVFLCFVVFQDLHILGDIVSYIQSAPYIGTRLLKSLFFGNYFETVSPNPSRYCWVVGYVSFYCWIFGGSCLILSFVLLYSRTIKIEQIQHDSSPAIHLLLGFKAGFVPIIPSRTNANADVASKHVSRGN